MDEAISVIIPTYNRRSLLEKTIDSVLSQTHALFELIVVDDGSIDDSRELITGYGRRVSYIYQSNQGPAAARNTGIRAARYSLLAFLDSDDRFDPRKLEIQGKAMIANPGILISHTEEVWYRRGKHLNQKKIHRKPAGDIYADSLRLCVVSMSTVMVRAEFFERVGLFDEYFPCCEDYDLWLRASLRCRFHKIPEALTFKEGGRLDEVSVIYRAGMDRFRISSILKILAEERLTENQRRLTEIELARKCRIYGNGCLKHGRREEGEFYLGLGRRAWQYSDSVEEGITRFC